VGGHLLVEGLGPEPPALPLLKSSPASHTKIWRLSGWSYLPGDDLRTPVRGATEAEQRTTSHTQQRRLL